MLGPVMDHWFAPSAAREKEKERLTDGFASLLGDVIVGGVGVIGT